jgi:hypothetical protein
MSGMEGKQRGRVEGKEFYWRYRLDNFKIFEEVGKRPKLENPYWIRTE